MRPEYSPDGRKILFASKGIVYFNHRAESRTEVELYDTGTGTVAHILTLDDAPHVQGMSISPDGGWIVYVA